MSFVSQKVTSVNQATKKRNLANTKINGSFTKTTENKKKLAK